MKNIYNKILKEALDIMDFNSWDDSEQVFKDDIEKSLEQVFIYIIPKNNRLQNDNARELLINKRCNIVDTEFLNNIIINGKTAKMFSNGWTFDVYPVEEKLLVIFKNLDNKLSDPHCSLKRLFSDCQNLVSVPLFNTSNVSDMSYMFNDCHSLKHIPKFNMEKVWDAREMFNNCIELEEVPQFDTPVLALADSMFWGCDKLTHVPIFERIANSWWMDGAQSLENMFQECGKLDKETRLAWNIDDKGTPTIKW